MKKANDYIIECEHDGSYIPVNEVKRILKQVQIDAIEKTVKLCAENAKVLKIVNSRIFGMDNLSNQYEQLGFIIDKQSILNCTEILKKKL